MQRDIAAELIGILRSLPPAIGMAARPGDDPADGLVLAIPEDPSWQVQVLPRGSGWSVEEVHLRPGPLGEQRLELGTMSAQDIPDAAAGHFRRLQLQVRNAACGTPIAPRPGIGGSRLAP